MESRSRNASRRSSISQHQESRKERDQSRTRAIFQKVNRFLSCDREPQDDKSTPVRYYERGHPLPTNCSPERKATIPFRNPELGLPSHRRRCETISSKIVSGLSPQRHMLYSNFRRGQSQSRTSPHSGSPRSGNVSHYQHRESRNSSYNRGSNLQSNSYSSSKRTSGKCSPSARRDSMISCSQSRSQISASNRHSSRQSRKQSPSQSSYGHSLDSEKLYRNLQSIASSAESDNSYYERKWSRRSRYTIEVDRGCYQNGNSSHDSGSTGRKSRSNTDCNSRDISPPGGTSSRKKRSHVSGYNSRRSPRSPASPERSTSTTPTRKQPLPHKAQGAAKKMDSQCTERSKSTIRRGLESLLLSENTRSASQPPLPEMTMEDYVVIADIPRANLYPDEEDSVVIRRRPQSRSPHRDNQNSYNGGQEGYCNHREPEERGRGRERGRDRREKERKRCNKDMEGSSDTNSTVSGRTQKSGEEAKASNRHERVPADQTLMQLDSPDFIKGWMFMLEDTAEWRKFWFVLSGSGLRYYTHLEDEERDKPDGEIDIRCCQKVMEFEVDTNYGLQLQMPDAEITLSVTTSRIRRNWIESLRSCIRTTESHDLVRKPHSSAGSQSPPPSSLHADRADSRSEVTGPPATPSSNQREAGVGTDQEQEKRFEDRTKWFQEGPVGRQGDSPWNRLELKKGVVPQVLDGATETDIEMKWKDLEKILVGEVRAASPPDHSEEPQAETASPRQQAEEPHEGRVEPGATCGCGPGSLCTSRLEQMEREHREKLRKMEGRRERERRETERRRDEMLKEEAQHAARAIEALRKVHLEKLEGLRGGEPSDATEAMLSLQKELDSLSDRYSLRCLELGGLQDSAGQRQSQLQEREEQIRALQRENRELRDHLTEEMAITRSFLTGQRSGRVSPGSEEWSASELQLILRAKENELGYLHEQIGCLRNQVRSLTEEKDELSERYKQVYVELCEIKGLGTRDVTILKEHLRLTHAALEEERATGHSPERSCVPNLRK